MRIDYHYTWNELSFTLLDKIVEKYGGSIYDKRCQRTWDPGQAMCAEIYGPDWMNDPQFKKDNQIPPNEPAPLYMLEGARRLAQGKSEWAELLEA